LALSSIPRRANHFPRPGPGLALTPVASRRMDVSADAFAGIQRASSRRVSRKNINEHTDLIAPAGQASVGDPPNVTHPGLGQ
jgi:hypothetical protein